MRRLRGLPTTARVAADESLLRYYDNIRKQVEADRGNKHKFVASASIKEYAESFRRGIVQTTTTPPAHRLGGRMSKQIRSHLPNQMTMIAPAVI
jgi:hypothetical protein